LNKTSLLYVNGEVGPIEVAVDEPDGQSKGLALIAHPHPLYGGTNENKVVQTLARCFVQLGYSAWRPNFRGIGKTAGEFDHGQGESRDLLTVLRAGQAELSTRNISAAPVLAGFSFGSFVQTILAQTLTQEGSDFERLVLVGPATTRFAVQPVRNDTLVVHGEKDDVVPLVNVFEWARPQSLPVVVVPDADHFFNKKLMVLKQVVLSAWGHPPQRD
jgi:uncharacterized protein